jgi:hypothetical protein
MTCGLSSLSYNFFAAKSTGAQSKTTARKMQAAKVNAEGTKWRIVKEIKFKQRENITKGRGFTISCRVGWGGGGGCSGLRKE